MCARKKLHKLISLRATLKFPSGSVDEMIVSIPDVALGIISDAASDMVAVIEEDNNAEISAYNAYHN